MASFNFNDADKYGSSGRGNYFSLKDDRDTATVRFMYESEDDLEGYSVHEVEIDGRRRYVNCLREYNQPIDDCPFCREHKPLKAKVFVPLYDVDSQETKVWERSKVFLNDLSLLCEKFEKKNRGIPLCDGIFDITRMGKKGDTKTRYDIDFAELANEEDDLPEKPEILGTFVLDKNADEMEYFLENGDFPSEDELPTRRERRSENRTSQRRTSRESKYGKDF